MEHNDREGGLTELDAGLVHVHSSFSLLDVNLDGEQIDYLQWDWQLVLWLHWWLGCQDLWITQYQRQLGLYQGTQQQKNIATGCDNDDRNGQNKKVQGK